MYKAIIIGCGKIAGIYDKDLNAAPHSHAHAYFKNPHIDVVCYVNRTIEKAKELAKKYNSDNYSDNYMESINRNLPDVVSICTPDNTHFDIIKSILDNSFVPEIIFVEKPVCSSQSELNYLETISNQKNVQIIVNHSRRFDEKHQNIKKIIKQNAFGKLLRGDIFYYGGWNHNGVHVVDTLRFLFEDEIDVVSITDYIPTGYYNDPTLELILFLKSQKAKVYLNAFDERYYQIFDMDFKFENARLRIEDFGSRIQFEKKQTNFMNENVLAASDLNIKNSASTPIENAIDCIANFLQTKNKNVLSDCSLEDTKKTMQILWEVEDEFKRKTYKQKPGN